MNKKIFLLFLLMVFTINLYSQIVSDTDIPPDIKSILNKKNIVVAMTSSDQPPFYFINKQGELDGIDVFIAKEMANKLGVEPVFNRESSSFNDVVTLVSSGKADLAISKLSRTLPRAQFVRFSNPYIVFKQCLLFNRLQLVKFTPEDNIRGFIRNMKGKIGIIMKSSYVGYARVNFPGAEIVEYQSWDDVINALYKGEVLAAYRDDLEISKILNSRSDATIKLKPVIFSDLTDPISIAVRYDRQQFLSWVNIFLESLSLDLNTEKLLDMYKDK